ncbi:hypothetical protein ACLK1S_18360 [Escherichia coli]
MGYQVENKPDDKPKLEVASWLEDVDGKQETRYAFIDEADHKTEDSLKAANNKIFAAFPGLKEVHESGISLTRSTVWTSSRDGGSGYSWHVCSTVYATKP